MSKKRAVLMSSAPLPVVPDAAPALGGGENLTQGGKTFMDKVSELEARFSKKKRKNTTKRAPRRRVSGRKTKGKNPKRQWYKRKFKLGNFEKTPRRSTARKDDDRWFLSRKTTLNSLINKMKIAKIPLSQLLSK